MQQSERKLTKKSDNTPELSRFNKHLKSRADSYKWNVRNLEALWYAIYDRMAKDEVEQVEVESEQPYVFVAQQDALSLPKTRNSKVEKDLPYVCEGNILEPVNEGKIKTRSQTRSQAKQAEPTTHDRPESGESEDEEDIVESVIEQEERDEDDEDDGDDPDADPEEAGARIAGDPCGSLPVTISRGTEVTLPGSDGSGYPDITIYMMKGRDMTKPSANEADQQAAFRRLSGVEVTTCYPLGLIEIKKAAARFYRRKHGGEQSAKFRAARKSRLNDAKEQLVLYINIIFDHPKYRAIDKVSVIAAAGPFWAWATVKRKTAPKWNFTNNSIDSTESANEARFISYGSSFKGPFELDTAQSEAEFKEFIKALQSNISTKLRVNHLL